MKLAREIIEDARAVWGKQFKEVHCQAIPYNLIIVAEDVLLSTIAAKLVPVREALAEAVELINSAGDEQEDGAAQSGPEFWHNAALLIGDVLAMLSEE